MNDIKIKEELIKNANMIRKKHKALKQSKYFNEEQLEETWKLVTQPLNKLFEIQQEQPMTSLQPYITPVPKTPIARTPSGIPALNTRPTPMPLEFGPLATEYLSNYIDNELVSDRTYGIYKKNKKFLIGNKEVEIANDDITIGDKCYKGTKGWWELITLKEPQDYKDEDLDNYWEILVTTSTHKKGYKPDEAMSGNKHKKYMNIIKPLIAKKTKSWEGLKVVNNNNKIDYIYWNDINELINRLRLLWYSREAGNTGVDNEIESILEELREEGII